MKNIFRDYFTFNKRERNGVFILLSIIAVLVFYLNISSHFVDSDPVDMSAYSDKIRALEIASAKFSDTSDQERTTVAEVKVHEERSKPQRFDFDPNGLPGKDWERLGLSNKQIRMIKNYESKGGKFRTANDLKKMYCISKELFDSLEPFIKIVGTSSHETREKSAEKETQKVALLIDLNSADSATLTTVKGIGPFYAKAIVKYRNELRGFVAKEQLMEIWKFDQEKFSKVESYFMADLSKVKKVNINTCQAADLKGPYIKWNVANAIVNYRNNHGKFNSVEEIMRTDLVDEETYRKIVPYLVIE